MFVHSIVKNNKNSKPVSSARKNSTPSKTTNPFNNILSLHKAMGNRAVESLIKSGVLQAKLTVGKPNDIYEQEADRMAEQVMLMPAPDITERKRVSKGDQVPSINQMSAEYEGKLHRQTQNLELGHLEHGYSFEKGLDMQKEGVQIQRICTECEEELQRRTLEEEEELQMQPAEEEEELQMQPVEEEEELQRQPIEEEEEEIIHIKKVSSQTPDVSSDIEYSIYSQRGGGQPLPVSSRSFFEPRLGYDFSNVRVHTGPESNNLNRSLNARAFTTGQDIFFRQGEYNPGSSGGRELLAHELTHVVQQMALDIQPKIQMMAQCPPTLASSDPVPSGWKAYHGNSCWFHCCYRGILENRRPSPDDPQNECFYDGNGALVDEHHEDAGCRGTPNQYDSASDWWRHTFEDEGGIWSRGWGAFWSSRWHDLNQHFEREGRRMMECHEICNQQPWYLRGFCLQGCSGTPPM